LDQDITKINPDPEEHTSVLWNTAIALSHDRLHGHRALDRVDHGGKLKQNAIPGGLDDTPSMSRHQLVGDGAVSAQNIGGADLIEPHEPRMARYVGGKYRR
jgi:hypothetical protein